MKLKLKESAVVRQVRDMAFVYGYEVHRIHVGRYRSMDGKRVITMAPTGTPDLLLVHPIKPVRYVETKATFGKVRKLQTLTHAALRQRGFLVDVVRNWEQVKRLFV